MTQKSVFLERVGDEWYERNKDDRGEDRCQVLNRLKRLPFIKPTQVLEVGCADGWRLQQLKTHYGCVVRGIEPSVKALEAGNAAAGEIFIDHGTADSLPYPDGSVDLLIYGYALGYVDPHLYLKVAAEGDRVLADNGWLVILDSGYLSIPGMLAPVFTNFGVYDAWWFRYDFRQLWLGHPAYKLQSMWVHRLSIAILRKSLGEAFLWGNSFPIPDLDPI